MKPSARPQAPIEKDVADRKDRSAPLGRSADSMQTADGARSSEAGRSGRSKTRTAAQAAPLASSETSGHFQPRGHSLLLGPPAPIHTEIRRESCEPHCREQRPPTPTQRKKLWNITLISGNTTASAFARKINTRSAHNCYLKFMNDLIPPLPQATSPIRQSKPAKGFFPPEIVRAISFYIISVCIFASVIVCILAIWDFAKKDSLWRLVASFLVLAGGTALFALVNGTFGEDRKS